MDARNYLRICGAVYVLLFLSALPLSSATPLEEEKRENSEEIDSLRSKLIASLSSQRAAARDALAIEKRDALTLRGNLKVYIRYASNLRDTDGLWNNPDPYVRVVAVTAAGSHIIRTTAVKQGTRNPTWNQWLDFGRETFKDHIYIQIWDDDDNTDDRLSEYKSFGPIQANYHGGLTHHAYDQGVLTFDYHMIMDGNECSPNPCRNGGTCTDLILSYTCNCRPGFGETNCAHRVGHLRVYARNGRNLQDRDGAWNDSDPYLEVIAFDANGYSIRKTTSVRSGTKNPNWYQTLDFGTRSWRRFETRVWDADNNNDDALSGRSTTSVTPGSRHYIRLGAYRGYVELDYYFD